MLLEDLLSEFLKLTDDEPKVFNVNVNSTDFKKLTFERIESSPTDNFVLPLFCCGDNKIFVHKVATFDIDSNIVRPKVNVPVGYDEVLY